MMPFAYNSQATESLTRNARKLTEQEMWNAVKENDASYDGLFFYGVKTTGIYCRPSCKSKVPKREHVCFFATAQEAISQGFRPCKRCRSDLLDYQPMQDIAAEVKEKIDEAFRSQAKLYEQLQNVGLTVRRLTDIFKDEYGVTPKEYADSLRLNEAKKLLTSSNKKIIDIAFMTGFSSLSAFNRFFKNQTGGTPSAYRRG